MIKSITIIGSGSWATALVKIFAESKVNVTWLVRNALLAEQIKSAGSNPRYLSQASLDMAYVHPVTDLEYAIGQSDFVLFAVPSAYLENITRLVVPEWLADKQVGVSIKGFIKGTGLLPSVFLCQNFPDILPPLVIGGPCHAAEIAMQRNTYVTVAAKDVAVATNVADAINVKYIQTILSKDPCGIEFVAILKNIIGIATGIANGLNYGENFQAVLTSNAMREVAAFLHLVSPVTRDLYDSAYYGDLLVTAYSDYSRNRTLGKLIGRGIKVPNALNVMEMVSEGYAASHELAPILKELNADMPVINSIHRILHQHANPFHEFKLIEQHLR